MDRSVTRKIRNMIDIAMVDYFYLRTVGDMCNSIEAGDEITYCGIGRYHEKSAMHVVVYNLHFGEYCQAIRDSWSNGGYFPDSQEKKEYYINHTKLLVISGTDYMTFREMETQKLLNIIQLRQRKGLATILCIPNKSKVCKGNDGSFQTMISPLYTTWTDRQEITMNELEKKRRENE